MPPMQRIIIRRGLNLPISGRPRPEISEAPPPKTVAVLGPDYVGMKPTMEVQVGDRVREGQLLFTDKKTPGVGYTSPGCGEVTAINRGKKRMLLSVVIKIDGDEAESFDRFEEGLLSNLPADKIKDHLVRTGTWPALRMRPFSKVPPPESTPEAIFVTAIDTNPLAAEPASIIAERADEFVWGLKALAQLTDGPLYLCTAPNGDVPGADLERVTPVEFKGPHPAGLPGTHIHFLDPAGAKKTVWYINYQDVMAVGSSLVTGRLDLRRVVAVGGPGVKDPRLLRTRLGACISDIVAKDLVNGNERVVSGSVLNGHHAYGPLDYLGRYHLQISVLPEPQKRELFGWYSPGIFKHSVKKVMASSLMPGKLFKMSTALHGGHRAIYPLGSYEQVMPLDIEPTFLLKALEVDDIDQAEALGALELDEEDLALCTYVCPGKNDHGATLRRNLTTIEKEG
jgi:Na+-transporting NADH:ubiquinone oxidoreductase subunit A